MNPKPLLKISVVSDVVCPWCYIGKRRLEKAMDKLSDRFRFEVEYFPFELNPDTSVSGVDQKSFLINKFGGEDRYNQITGHVANVASGEGLVFNFQDQKTLPNTRDAHRLIQWARNEHKQILLVEALFKGYFTHGIDLSQRKNLVALAGSVGLNETEAIEVLENEVGLAEIEMTTNKLQQSGITGVPFYIVENKFGISGAQPTSSFIQAFEEIASAASLPVPNNGEACDVDDKNC
jgi:predicted DsbA family dithiol-disulfide isomerase